MWPKIRALLFGAPKDVRSEKTFHSISLVAMLAWVGLGADGLSSSSYGPDAAFREIMTPEHDFSSLAAFLALGTAVTVFIISYAYTRIIEHFPSGGGGYVVATKLLGPRFGVVSGSALLVDYILTITTSIAPGGDAILYLIPRDWFGKAATSVLTDDIGSWLDPVQRTKVTIEITAIGVLIILNIRGIKESVAAITPIFAAFVLTHAVLLVVAIGGHLGDVGAVTHEASNNLHGTVASLGVFGALALTVKAYSLGGGTYTGIEAVSNGVPIMREPKVRTAKRTMVLMAASLSITAGGIILSYLLVHVAPDFQDATKPMNAILLDQVAGAWHVGDWAIGKWFVLIALCSEAGLLFIAAQAGFVDGPRVMANMAIDSWLPHKYAALSERLSMQNGVILMGGTSIAALIYTHGNVEKLVVMYSINVFLTFSLSNLGMARFWVRHRAEHDDWYKHLPVHVVGLALCVTILIVTSVVKFAVGGWLTLVVTGLLVAGCLWIKRHYNMVVAAIRRLDVELADPLVDLERSAKPSFPAGHPGPLASTSRARGRAGARSAPPGRDALRGRVRRPRTARAAHALAHVPGPLQGHRLLLGRGHRLRCLQGPRRGARAGTTNRSTRSTSTCSTPSGWGSRRESTLSVRASRWRSKAEKIATELIQKYPRGLFVAGQLIFDEDTFVTRILHNETAFTIQRRLQHAGVPMVVLPVRLNLKEGPRLAAPSLTEERPV